VERVGPRAPTDSPLGRSGVAIDDLLFATDLLETREAVAPVAMELGLETARRQLLQRMAAESLESLDAVWARAAGSEEGWYLRAGALTMLGHPHEGDKVAADGLESQPQSLALRFMRKLLLTGSGGVVRSLAMSMLKTVQRRAESDAFARRWSVLQSDDWMESALPFHAEGH
jgi:hypothetical protein